MSFPDSVVRDRFERAGGRCECCNRLLLAREGWPSLTLYHMLRLGVTFEAHHVVPQHENGPNTVDNCRVLCIPCHKATASYGTGEAAG